MKYSILGALFMAVWTLAVAVNGEFTIKRAFRHSGDVKRAFFKNALPRPF